MQTSLDRTNLVTSSRNVAMFALVGATFGAATLGIGLYLASYADMLMPFYQIGAAAGGVAGLLFGLSTSRPRVSGKSTALKGFLTAAVGGLLAWWWLGNRGFEFSPAGRSTISILWSIAEAVIMISLSSVVRYGA
jgi:hypothetical protein